MIGIYKITSPSGRVYIGQAVDISTRKKTYEKANCKQQPRLYRSINKYGFSEHDFTILEECAEDILNERERYWQDFYSATNSRGLNCRLTETGDKSGKLSEASIGVVKRALRYKRNTPVYQFTLEGDLLRMYESTIEAGRILGDVTKGSSISSCCNGRQSTAFGYIWSYSDYVKTPTKITHQHGKVVLQLDLGEDTIREYDSPKDAVKQYGKSIYDCLADKQKSAYGFIWKYKN